MRAAPFTTFDAVSPPRWDVAVVGAGPAGIVLAKELDRRGLSVVVLEAGPAAGTDELDDLQEETSTGAPRVRPMSAVRNRGIGGTSRTWSGRVAEFESDDLAERPWIPHSGWPITSTDLAPYYLRAHPYFAVPVTDQPTLVHAAGAQPGEVAPGLDPFVWTYSRTPEGDHLRFGPRALAEADGIVCFTGARVRAIEVEGGAFRWLAVVGDDGVERRVEAGTAVLCAGGIENARLLLLSREAGAAGEGAEHVGRYLMDHPRGEIARFPQEAATGVQARLGTLHRRLEGSRVLLTLGFELSAAAQRDGELLGSALWVAPSVVDRAPVPLNPAQKALRVLGSVSPDVRAQATALRHRASPVRRRDMSVQCIVEQEPDPDSRVTLGAATDRFGQPVAEVHWRVGDREKRTVRRIAAAFSAWCAGAGLPAPQALPWLAEEGPHPLPDVAHPIGTTRMARSAAGGVVDPRLGVFGVAGLHVCGSSVFPTSGHVNPTLTIVALAIRLADQLSARSGG